jgi:hypothetical protein
MPDFFARPTAADSTTHKRSRKRKAADACHNEVNVRGAAMAASRNTNATADDAHPAPADPRALVVSHTLSPPPPPPPPQTGTLPLPASLPPPPPSASSPYMSHAYAPPTSPSFAATLFPPTPHASPPPAPTVGTGFTALLSPLPSPPTVAPPPPRVATATEESAPPHCSSVGAPVSVAVTYPPVWAAFGRALDQTVALLSAIVSRGTQDSLSPSTAAYYLELVWKLVGSYLLFFCFFCRA